MDYQRIEVVNTDQTEENAQTEPMSEDSMGTVANNTASKTALRSNVKTSALNQQKRPAGTNQAVLAGAAIMAARQGANLVLSNVGLMTGDSVVQSRVNTGLRLATYGMILLSGNPLLIGGAVISVGAEAIQYGIKEGHRRKIETAAIQSASIYKNLAGTSNGRKRL